MYAQRFERNSGFLNATEQSKLQDATVSIAGVGGDGALVAVELARMGVGSFRLADPDPFEIENSNRQAVCNESTIGVNKAQAVGDYLNAINPDANIELFKDGITRDNTEDFVHGANLVIDETEFTYTALGVMLHRATRPRKIPVLTALNLGFGAMVTTYHPEGRTLERQLGFTERDSLDYIAKAYVSISRWLPYLPTYGDLKVLEKVASGEKSAPSISPGVAIAAGVAATEAFLNIVGTDNKRRKPIYAPKVRVMDAMSGDSKVIKFNRSSHYRHLAKAVVINMLKKNPQADY